jgi:hypothetical protein
MPGSYDQDTQKFISDVMPTRDPSPRPTQTQSPDVQPGNTAATYPDGWREHAGFAAKQLIGATSKIREGGRPVAVITKAVLKTSLKDALRQQEKQASVSDALGIFHSLNERYGDAWHDWEPETLSQTIAMDLEKPPSGGMLDILQAFQVILKTNQAHESWHVFENVGQALNENHVDFDIVQPLRPDEVAFAVRVIDSLRKEKYDQEVLAYMAACAKHSGMVFMPVSYFPEGCQAFLDGMGNDEGLKASVERKYTSGEGGGDMQEKIQLDGLKEIEDYVRVRI